MLYRPAQITDSQIPPATLAGITPDFRCGTAPGPANRGQLTTRAQELAGPAPAIGGYTPCVYTPTVAGAYWVALYRPDGPNGNADGNAGTIGTPTTDATQNSGVSMWDITVRTSQTSTTNINGRVYVDYLAQISGGNGAAYQMYSRCIP